ncbi:MAG TPA: hypothetical protein VIQ79_09850, partial [Kribbella sp.]
MLSLPGDVSLVWRILALIVAGYLLLLVTLDLGEQARQRLGRRQVASLVWSAPLLAGLAVGAGLSAGAA